MSGFSVHHFSWNVGRYSDVETALLSRIGSYVLDSLGGLVSFQAFFFFHWWQRTSNISI